MKSVLLPPSETLLLLFSIRIVTLRRTFTFHANNSQATGASAAALSRLLCSVQLHEMNAWNGAASCSWDPIAKWPQLQICEPIKYQTRQHDHA